MLGQNASACGCFGQGEGVGELWEFRGLVGEGNVPDICAMGQGEMAEARTRGFWQVSGVSPLTPDERSGRMGEPAVALREVGGV